MKYLTTLPEAIEILSDKSSNALPLAGGKDLPVRMKKEEITPSVGVNLKRIEALPVGAVAEQMGERV